MTESKLTSYRLPFSVFVVFIAYSLLAHTPLNFISSLTSSFIHYLYEPFVPAEKTEQVSLVYGILVGVIAHFWFGKLCKIDDKENRKSLLKGLGFVVLIIGAYGLNMYHQS